MSMHTGEGSAHRISVHAGEGSTHRISVAIYLINFICVSTIVS